MKNLYIINKLLIILSLLIPVGRFSHETNAYKKDIIYFICKQTMSWPITVKTSMTHATTQKIKICIFCFDKKEQR